MNFLRILPVFFVDGIIPNTVFHFVWVFSQSQISPLFVKCILGIGHFFEIIVIRWTFNYCVLHSMCYYQRFQWSWSGPYPETSLSQFGQVWTDLGNFEPILEYTRWFQVTALIRDSLEVEYIYVGSCKGWKWRIVYIYSIPQSIHDID